MVQKQFLVQTRAGPENSRAHIESASCQAPTQVSLAVLAGTSQGWELFWGCTQDYAGGGQGCLLVGIISKRSLKLGSAGALGIGVQVSCSGFGVP